jgi:hypothetical protein
LSTILRHSKAVRAIEELHPAGYFEPGNVEHAGLFARSVKLAEWLGCPWLIENPVSSVSKYRRKPDHTFDPCDYGD